MVHRYSRPGNLKREKEITQYWSTLKRPVVRYQKEMSSTISSTEDTIAAIATPPGVGGLAVVRVSGENSTAIVNSCITLKSDLTPFTASYTSFVDPGTSNILDEVIVTYFQAPKSFTAEDVVEISCHGGHFIAESILRVLLNSGARLSEPGEFTKRAFLNGRIDLSQAEAVGDLIAAQTSASHRVAMQQLRGQLKEKVSGIRQSLMDMVSVLELELDFSEEELDKTPHEEIVQDLEKIKSQCISLAETYSQGKLFRRGVLAPIVGKPNSGKSSILNALLKEDRALVSDIPGTTRDTLEESISHKGVEIRLVDTAGLRSSLDTIESMGISRAEDIMQQADVLIHVVDARENEIPEIQSNKTPVLNVLNKIDLFSESEQTDLRVKYGNGNTVFTSATELSGITEIGNGVLHLVLQDASVSDSTEDMAITNERHKHALDSAISSLNQSIDGAAAELSPEFIVVDLRSALNSLGLLTGETTTDDILNNIFANFCIGK
jgi:tRNA modification GTPase